ncbi:Cysteine-rich domain-containing protein [Streptomyces sp. KS_16]|nr:Cysteine-rich domain-containing protein [Streptomyces sp. KS_16]
MLWPDTFSNHLHPNVAKAAVRVLEDAGFHLAVPLQPFCCGLTWISTGQLSLAKRVLDRTVTALRPWIEAGTPVIGLEPSCTAVFHADALELLPHDPDIQRLARQFRTFAEQLVHHAPDGWKPPRLGRPATVQTHCHQHAVLGDDADRELMRRAGVEADVLDSGCCGLAGNFGFERGHHDISMTIAEHGVLSAVRATHPDALVLADGFSCRTQITDGDTGRGALHLAEALALGLEGPLPTDAPEHAAPRPRAVARDARLAAAGALAALGALGAGVGSALHRRGMRITRVHQGL